MVVSIRNLALVSAFLPAALAGADPAAPLAGHWEGAIHALEDVAVAVDLAADEAGKLGGTFSSASQRLNGFPLSSASVDGETVKIELKRRARRAERSTAACRPTVRRSRASS